MRQISKGIKLSLSGEAAARAEEERDAAPAMPTQQCIDEPHGVKMATLYWEKLGELSELQYALVARVVNQAEIDRTPEAKEAMDKEWQKLLTSLVGCTLRFESSGMRLLRRSGKGSRRTSEGSLKFAALMSFPKDTWSNSRGSTSKIDFVLLSTPELSFVVDEVLEDTDYLLGCDHRAVRVAFRLVGRTPRTPRQPRPQNRRGQWRIDGPKAIQKCAQLVENIELRGRDLTVSDLEGLSNHVSYRPKSYRYKDPPYILDMIKQSRTLVGREARDLGEDILRMRASAKTAWLTELLDKGSQGDYRAIAYFKRRQNTLTMHSNYVVRAGGAAKATEDLKQFFRLKYTPLDPPPQ